MILNNSGLSYSATSPLFQEEIYQYDTQVMVVLAKAWEEYTSEQQRLLEKILTSVKIDIHSVQMISLPIVSLTSLTNFAPARVLIFGSATKEDIGLYQQTPAQGFIVVKADDLTQLDDSRKKNLWMALRPMFGV